MRYAIFSDIHGNLEAWNKVLEDIRSLQADVLICLGDVVGYGPLPEQVLNAIRAETDHFVMGNHDAAAVGILESSYFNPHARTVIEWTREQLSAESLEFLRGVPLSIEGENMHFVHAEITEPARFGYITDAVEAAENFQSSEHFVTFVGHTHQPTIFELTKDGVVEHSDNNCTLAEDERYIVNVGSVGEPRNPDDLSARYVIYDSDTRQVSFRKVQFDPEVYRQHLQATTLEVSPYFLSVWDHQIGDSPAPDELVIDMEAPVDTANLKFKFAQSAKLDKTAIRKAVAKEAARSRMMTMLVVFTCVCALIGAGLFFWWQGQSNDNDPPIIAQEPTPSEPAAAGPDEPVEPSIDPESSPTTVTSVDPEPEPSSNPVPAEPPVVARYVRIQAPGPARLLGLSEVQVFNNGENIALDGIPTQASNLTPHHVAAFAIDDSTDNDGAKIAMTSVLRDPWWELDLGVEYAINRVKIQIPSSQQPLEGRLEILLANRQRELVWMGETDPSQATYELATTASTNIELNLPQPVPSGVAAPDLEPEPDEDKLLRARFVRVSKESESALSLAEVIVESRGGRNIARGGTASQSSDYSDEFPANLAIDGNTDGNIGNLSTTHTHAGDSVHWWEVDLGAVNPIKSINLWNRAKYQDRLQDFTVQILDAERNVVWEQLQASIPSPDITLYPGNQPGTPPPNMPATQPENMAPNAPVGGAVAWWKMDQDPAAELLIDAMETNSLELVKLGRKIPNVAPELSPATGELNTGALSLGIWKEREMSGFFQLRADRSFTLEGWFMIVDAKKPVLLAGTWDRGGESQQGWRVDFRPDAVDIRKGPMAFYYHNGAEATQAISDEVMVNTREPQHFAAVWDHDAAASAGEMRLFLNGAQIASIELPHASIPEKQANPFQIGSPLNPLGIGVDEFRFTQAALVPARFDTASYDFFFTDFTEESLEEIPDLKFDIPNPDVGKIKLDTKNDELDLTSTQRVDLWSDRKDAPIAYTPRPVVSEGETWFAETHVHLNGKVGVQERVAGMVLYPDVDGLGGGNGGMQWSVHINEWNDTGISVQRFTPGRIGDTGEEEINPDPLVKDIREALFRIEVTENGKDDAYRVFYKLPEGATWIEITAFNSGVDNSRIGLFFRNRNIDDDERSQSYKYFRVGLK